MKKTLTLLLTALMTAAAANADLVASFDSLTGLSQTSGEWSFYNNKTVAPVFNTNKTATFKDGGDVLYLQHASGNVNLSNYTLTMTISGLQAGGNANNTLNTLFTVGGNTWGACLSSDDHTKLTGLAGNKQWNDANNKAFTFPTDAPFTLTVTMGTKDSNNGTYFYINGQEACFIQGLYAGKMDTKQYCIGNNSGGSDGTSFTLHNLYVHNTRLSADEVAKFYASIPEPASASLSLVGLAALLMRRKRA